MHFNSSETKTQFTATILKTTGSIIGYFAQENYISAGDVDGFTADIGYTDNNVTVTYPLLYNNYNNNTEIGSLTLSHIQ